MAKQGAEFLLNISKNVGKSWLTAPEGAVIDAFKGVILSSTQSQTSYRPQSNVTQEVSQIAFTQLALNSWKQVEELPYVKPFMGVMQQSGNGRDGIFNEDSTTNPLRNDHFANRSFVDPRLQTHLITTQGIPQISPFGGVTQSLLPFRLLGITPITSPIRFEDKFVEGKGYNNTYYPDIKLPRWFFSEQDITQLPHQYTNRLFQSIASGLNSEPLHDITDMRLLLAADAGEHLEKEQAEYLGNVTLAKTIQRRYTLDEELLHDLGVEESNGVSWAEYTRNAYQRGTDLNHGTTPVHDIVFASEVMQALGIPAVPNQGLGTVLQQGAAGGKKWPFFQEFILRVQEQDKNGNLAFHPNGEPVFIEEGFNFNANAIFSAVSLQGNSSEISPEAIEAVKNYALYARIYAPAIYQQMVELNGPAIQELQQELRVTNPLSFTTHPKKSFTERVILDEKEKSEIVTNPYEKDGKWQSDSRNQSKQGKSHQEKVLEPSDPESKGRY